VEQVMRNHIGCQTKVWFLETWSFTHLFQGKRFLQLPSAQIALTLLAQQPSIHPWETLKTLDICRINPVNRGSCSAEIHARIRTFKT
jgi:hypothetical protein